jgi:ubiquinone/menaquinone biosynthesis C-methylase UbiE
MSEAWTRLKRDPAEVIRYLETATQRLDVIKRKSIAMLRLRPGSAVLDVGCGLGRDAEIISRVVGCTGRVIGIDRDRDLVIKAIERTERIFPRPEFYVGNALELEFRDNTFNASRIDRVLQHLDEPAQAVLEMIRVTLPNGRISILDVDWHTLTISGGEIAVSREVTWYTACATSRQGDIGRRLIQLLMDAGCKDVEVDAEVSIFRSLGAADFTLQIRNTLEATISSGAITRDAGEIWWRAVEELDARNCFFASVNVVVCAGTVS